MSYRFSLLFLLPIFFNIPVSAQASAIVAETTCHAYEVVEGRSYVVSASPDSDADVAFGVGFEPGSPMSVVNSRGKGLSETYRADARSDELQVCVYLNKKDAGHSVVVIDADQRFPFFKWREKSIVSLETDSEGYITSFGFRWKRRAPVRSRASSNTRDEQNVAAGSAISYSFSVIPGVPIDVVVVPESNHLDLALHSQNADTFETRDNNRSAANLSETESGQVEWLQINPEGELVRLIVENKSSFGGSFRMAVRRLDSKSVFYPPVEWKFLDTAEFQALVEKNRSRFPFISTEQGVTYEFTPTRTVESYSVSASALEPGLNFALLVRTDPSKPPLFVQAGGRFAKSAVFKWRVSAGEVSLFEKRNGFLERSAGYPARGKIEISIVGYGGSGRVAVLLDDADTLGRLNTPPPRVAARDELTAPLSARYEGYGSIDSHFRLYRFKATPGQSYSVKVTPDFLFDAALLDPSNRTLEDPGDLQLVDDRGQGGLEGLEVVAAGDLLEFGVAGIRYAEGLVASENKRLGGRGFYRVEVQDGNGEVPELIEVTHVALPNEFVSKELGLEFQPWDEFKLKDASDLPPFPVAYDRRITSILGGAVKQLSMPVKTIGTQFK